MAMRVHLRVIILLSSVVMMSSCRKPDEVSTTSDSDISGAIINDLSSNVIRATYVDLTAEASALYSHVLNLNSATTESNLTVCKQSWRDCRQAWEQSESFLFGPVATENIDPRIDTWPVNFNDLDSVLASSATFTSGYIDSLDDALKGFHPIEYLLFGENGNKSAIDFTQRELDYLVSLTGNLLALTSELALRWDPNSQSSFFSEFTLSGSGSSIFPTRRSAYEEMVGAMIGICDEVANGKILEPFTLQDPSLEESPFAFNSITDFTNNIRGVENIYRGVYSIDGRGIEDLVREHNLSLDQQIKQKIQAAIATLGTVTVPFGQAITQQPIQVQNCINAINDLKTTLENDLLPFVQMHVE